MMAINALSGLETEYLRVFNGARSKPLRTMRQFAEEDLVLPDGPFKGEPFKISTQPITGLLLDELDLGYWYEAFITGPSQSGKTFIAFVTPMAYHTSEINETYIVGLPDMQMAQNKWEIDIVPIFRASPRLRRLLPNKGPGSRGGKITDMVTLTNGAVVKFMTAGGDDTSKAGFTSRCLGITEAARFSNTSNTSVEADPLRQLRARLRSHTRKERKTYAEGTVTLETELPWTAYPQSSQGRILTPCPHCEVHVAPEREHFGGFEEARSEEEAAELARFYCPACGEEIDDVQRRSVMADSKLIHKGQSIDKRGRVRGDLPPTRRLWFRWSAWHNMLLSLSDIGVDEWLAAQTPEDSDERENAERDACQFVWCIPYDPPELEVEKMEAGDVTKRSAANLPKGVLPDDAEWLTLFCDCGMYRLHWVAMAWRANHTAHVCDYETIEVLHRGKGTVESRRKAVKVKLLESLGILKARCQTGWPLRGMMKMPDRIAIDARYLPDVVHPFTAAAGANFYPAIGVGTGQQEKKQYNQPKKKTRAIRHLGERYYLERHKKHRTLGFVNDSDYWKSQVQDMFQIDEGERGSVTMFRDDQTGHKTFERHLLAEEPQQQLHPRHGLITVWTNSGKANHFLDGTYGNLVLGHHCGFRITGDQLPKEEEEDSEGDDNWFANRRR